MPKSLTSKKFEEHNSTPVSEKTIPFVKKNLCSACGKVVYLMERFFIEGRLFHRVCFKCVVCGKQLKTSTYEFDKLSGKFYCTKDYKERKTTPGVSNIKTEETIKQNEKNDDKSIENSGNKSPQIKKVLKSPFKRNEQFKRQGLHSQSPSKLSRNEEELSTIKSKEASTKVTGKGKPSKSFFSGVLGKKHHEFTNPSYDKHLDLSNYMHKLNEKKNTEPVLLSSQTTKEKDHDTNKTYENKDTLEIKEKDKDSKGHKRKLVLKIKKKKDKKTISEDKSKQDIKDAVDSIKNDAAFPPTPPKGPTAIEDSEYENLGKYMKMNSVIMRDNAEKIYDNINLCKVLKTEDSQEIEKFDSTKSETNQPFSSHKDSKKMYDDDVNMYQTPNVHPISKEDTPERYRSPPPIYETMGSCINEVNKKKNELVESPFMLVTRTGHVSESVVKSNNSLHTSGTEEADSVSEDTGADFNESENEQSDDALDTSSDLENINDNNEEENDSNSEGIYEDLDNVQKDNQTFPSANTAENKPVEESQYGNDVEVAAELVDDGTESDECELEEDDVSANVHITNIKRDESDEENELDSVVESEKMFHSEENDEINDFDEDEGMVDNTVEENETSDVTAVVVDVLEEIIGCIEKEDIAVTNDFQPFTLESKDSETSENAAVVDSLQEIMDSCGKLLAAESMEDRNEEDEDDKNEESEDEDVARSKFNEESNIFEDVENDVKNKSDIVPDSENEENEQNEVNEVNLTISSEEEKDEIMEIASNHSKEEENSIKSVDDDDSLSSIAKINESQDSDVKIDGNEESTAIEEVKDVHIEEKKNDIAAAEIKTKTVKVKVKSQNPFDDSSDEESDEEVSIKKTKQEPYNPFLSSDEEDLPSSPKKKDPTNPFFSSGDEEEEDFEDYDDSNPFAEDARLERNNTLERSKGKTVSEKTYQIGIIEETNPGVDDLLDPSNPFSDEFDDDFYDDSESSKAVIQDNVEAEVPLITSKMPSSDKKLVLKKKKRAAPQIPTPQAVSSPMAPTPIRQSRKKRVAPKPPDENTNKFNTGSLRRSKRKAPRPPVQNIFNSGNSGNESAQSTPKTERSLRNTESLEDSLSRKCSLNESVLSSHYSSDNVTVERNDSVQNEASSSEKQLDRNIPEKEAVDAVEISADIEKSEITDGMDNMDTTEESSMYVTADQSFYDSSVMEQEENNVQDGDIKDEVNHDIYGTNGHKNDVSNVQEDLSENEMKDGIENDEEIDDDSCDEIDREVDQEYDDKNDIEVDQGYDDENNIQHDPDVESDDDSNFDAVDNRMSYEMESNISTATSNSSISQIGSACKLDSDQLNQSIYSTKEDSSTECDAACTTEFKSEITPMIEQNTHQVTNTLPHRTVSNVEHRQSLPNIHSPDTQSNEKRKAPPKPPRQYTEFTDSNSEPSQPKQPKREEISKELQFLEVKQRELEMEGVVLEKKLREDLEGESEESYLLTWFELVNEKNQLLRRENELIYMCQELDFLQNQRSAELELRQLMMKPDDEKTEYDTNREAELLAEILSYVTKRSNIIDQMDEDRKREEEEDQEILSMMACQGFGNSTSNINENNEKKKSKERSLKIKKKSKSTIVSNDIKNETEKVKKKKEKVKDNKKEKKR